MSTSRVRLEVRRRPARWLAASVVVTFAAAVALWVQLRHAASPQAVAERTERALDDRDVSALLGLATDEERSKLNLNAGNVDAILRETLWLRTEPGSRHTFRRVAMVGPPDVAQWIIEWTPRQPGAQSRRLPFLVLMYPDGSWHLSLSHVLYMACRHVLEGPAALGVNPTLAAKYGVRGVLWWDGTYIMMDELWHRARSVLGSASSYTQWSRMPHRVASQSIPGCCEVTPPWVRLCLSQRPAIVSVGSRRARGLAAYWYMSAIASHASESI